MNKTKMIVYGTLRPKDYNFSRFGRGLKSVSEGYIKGYRLYDLGAYPCCVHTGDEEDIVAVSIIESQDDNTQEFIDMMEGGAGYVESEADFYNNISDPNPHERHKVYLYEKPSGKLISSGDWYARKFNSIYNPKGGTKEFRIAKEEEDKRIHESLNRIHAKRKTGIVYDMGVPDLEPVQAPDNDEEAPEQPF